MASPNLWKPFFLAFKLEQKVSNHWKMATSPSLNIIFFLFLFFGISLKCSKYYLRYISDHPKSIDDTCFFQSCRTAGSGSVARWINCSARLGPLWWQCQLTLGQKKVCIRIHIFDSKKQTNKNKNTKKANRISLQNWLKNKFVAFPVHIFLIAHISG